MKIQFNVPFEVPESIMNLARTKWHGLVAYRKIDGVCQLILWSDCRTKFVQWLNEQGFKAE